MVTLRCVEREVVALSNVRRESDLAPEARRQGNGDLVDIDHQRVAFPVEGAWTNGEVVRPIIQCIFAAFGHRPACFGSVECDIDRDVVIRVFATRPGVVGREDRTDKGDDRKAIAAIIA